MAITFGADLGTASQTGGTSITKPSLAGVGVGDRIIVVVTYWTNGNGAVTSVTDGRGNTYTKEGEAIDAGGDHAEVWSADVTTGLFAGDNITATFNQDPTGGIFLGAASFSGITGVDTTNTASGSGSSWSSGSATNAVADALFFGALGVEDTTAGTSSTPVNGTELWDLRRDGDGQNMVAGYTIAASSASRDISGTLSNGASTLNLGALVVYSGTGGGGTTYDDTPSGTATVTGSITESYDAPVTYDDSPTGTATITGAITESYAATYDDAPTGTVSATGSIVEYAGVLVSVPSSTVAPSSFEMPSSNPVYNDTPAGGPAASGSISEDWAVVAFPSVTTLIDDFNRADSTPIYGGTGGAIWQTQPIVSGSPVLNVFGSAVDGSVSGAEAVTWAQFGPDVDFTFDLANLASLTTANYIAAFFAFQSGGGSWPDAAFSGYALILGLTAANEWSLHKYTGGTGSSVATFGTQAIAIGDSVGVSMRGSTITAYYKPSGGAWAPVGSPVTDTTYNRAGFLGLEVTQNGIDNLSGGTVSAGSTFNDAPTGTRAPGGTLSESYSTANTASDAPTGSLTPSGSVTDALTLADAPTGSAAATGALADTLEGDDTPTGATSPTGALAESYGSGNVDAPVGTVVVNGSVVDALTVNVTPTGGPTATGTRTASHAYDETPVGAVSPTGGLAEFRTLTVFDSPTGGPAITGTVREVNGRGNVDSPLDGPTVSGSTVESHMHSSFPVHGATVTGTPGETWTHSGSVAGAVTPTGAIVEFTTHSTQGTSPGGHVLHPSAPQLRRDRRGGEIRRNK